MMMMINDVIDFPAAVFHLSNTEHVNWSVQKPVSYLSGHLCAGVFHLDHNCKSESASCKKSRSKRRLHYIAPEKTRTHPTGWTSFPMGEVKVH